jgi:thiol-disulfide isomerase/thioredoxin
LEELMLGAWKSWAGRSFALIGVAAALYGIVGCSSKSDADLKSLAKGEMKDLAVEGSPAPAPKVPFTDAAGRRRTLADFKGKVVVLNLWATWCAPCVAEMPTLAKLQSQSAGKPLVVVPVSLDAPEDRANAQAFLARRPPLVFYAEPTYELARAFNPSVEGLPTTVLIDASGNVRARLSGGADWSSPAAEAILDKLEKGG